MSKEMLDMIEAATRAVTAAQKSEAARAICPTHGATYRGR